MILEFVLSAVLAGLILYLPGYFFLKAARLSTWRAVAFAPAITLPLYCILGISYDKVGIFATAVNIGLPVLLVALIAWWASKMLMRRKRSNASLSCDCKERASSAEKGDTNDGAIWSRLLPLSYIAVGLVVYFFAYLNALPELGNAAETYDNVFHYNLIRSFVDSGIWSTLNGSVYLDLEHGYPAAFMNDGQFYPSAWHIVASFAVSLLDVPVGIAVNATNFVFVCLVYPLAMFTFFQEVFKGDRRLLVFGAFVVFAFGAFPWILLAHWPLFPNLVSTTFVPLLCAAFIAATKAEVPRKRRVGYAVIFLFGIMAAAFCQPNAVFTAMVVLAPYVVYTGSRAIIDRARRGRSSALERSRGDATSRPVQEKRMTRARWIAGIAITLLIVGAWFVLFKLPFLQSTVNYYWAPLFTISQSIASAISLSLSINSPQYALGILVMLGALYIIAKRHDLIWALASYVIAVALFVVAASLGDCWIKHFLTGFWYTDPYRLAAIVGLAGVPLAALGLCAAAKIIRWFIGIFWPAKSKKKDSRRTRIIGIVVVAIVCCAIYAPITFSSGRVTMFQHIYNIAETHTGNGEWVPYNKQEKEFVAHAKEIVSEDDVVINQPYDGSMMAYGLSDLPIYYRSISGYGNAKESEEAALMRERLVRFASDPEVQAAVANTSADYVLILEGDQEKMMFPKLKGRVSWEGIDTIDDTTPGFELVLEEGDMKLYKILSTEDED